MARYLFTFLVAIHGSIHLLGFVKFLRSASGTAGKEEAILWLLCTLCFWVLAFLFFRQERIWPLVAIPTIVLSQLLIATEWAQARYGSIANGLILLAVLLALLLRQANLIFRD